MVGGPVIGILLEGPHLNPPEVWPFTHAWYPHQ